VENLSARGRPADIRCSGAAHSSSGTPPLLQWFCTSWHNCARHFRALPVHYRCPHRLPLAQVSYSVAVPEITWRNGEVRRRERIAPASFWILSAASLMAALLWSTGYCHPFLFVDAFVVKVREGGQVRSCSVLMVIAVHEEGHCEILVLQLGESESERSWIACIRWRKGRGLSGIDLTAGDHHGELTSAIHLQCSSKGRAGNATRCTCPPASAVRHPRRCRQCCMRGCARSLRHPTCRPPRGS
jgi:hypothetical protein